jgi:hypothetical protein
MVNAIVGVKRANGSLPASDGFGQRADERSMQFVSPSGCWRVVCRRIGRLARLTAARTWRAISAWSPCPSNVEWVNRSVGAAIVSRESRSLRIACAVNWECVPLSR